MADTAATGRRTERVMPFRTPRGRTVDMVIREGTNDWNTLNACMTEDEYGLADWHGSGVALDIGGYLGGVGIALAVDNPALRVVIVEPVPLNAALIRKNIDGAGVSDRVSLVEGAVGDGSDVTVMFNYTGSESMEHHAWVGNSTLAYEDSRHGHESLTYRSVTLRDLIRDAGAERISLCKIDTEGAEWAFLDSTAVALVDEFRGEWHPVRGHVQTDMLALLGGTHDVTFDGPEAGPGGFRAVTR